MKPDLAHPIFKLADRLRSAVKTGRRLHLEPAQARLLMSGDIYQAIMKLEAEETSRACLAATVNDNSWGTSGFGNGRASAAGTSAGLSGSTAEASRGASRLLQEAAAQTIRRRKP